MYTNFQDNSNFGYALKKKINTNNYDNTFIHHKNKKNIQYEVESDLFLKTTKEYKNETTKNFNNLSISNDYKILFEIAEKKGPKKSLVIMGISSWGPGQLEGEMEKETWVLSESNTDLIFDIDNAKKWLNAINSSFIRL